MLDDTLIGWEGIAAELLERTGCGDPPVDAFELAGYCGLSVRLGDCAASYLLHRERAILVPRALRSVAQHGRIRHELAHFALRRAREDDCEAAARYIGGALGLPWHAFDRDLAETGWRFDELQRRHPYCSAEAIARRITTMRDAAVLIVDNGSVSIRLVSPWLSTRTLRAGTPLEYALAKRALEVGSIVHEDDLVYAVPLVDGIHRRVVVVSDYGRLVELSIQRKSAGLLSPAAGVDT